MTGYRALMKTNLIIGMAIMPVGLVPMFSQKESLKRLSPAGNETTQKVFDKVTGEEVKISECKSGYELEKGKFVEIDKELIKEEFKAEAKGIKILKFVEEAKISRYLFDKSYYLNISEKQPKEAKLMYKAVCRVLFSEGLVAFGTILMRGTLHNCIIRSDLDCLILTTLQDIALMRENVVNLPKDQPNEQYLQAVKLQVLGLKGELDKHELEDKYLKRLRQVVLEVASRGQKEVLEIIKKRNEMNEVKELLTAKREIDLEKEAIITEKALDEVYKK